MAEATAGVTLVVRGAASFLSSINQATQTVRSFAEATTAAAQKTALSQQKLSASIQQTTVSINKTAASLAAHNIALLRNENTLANAQAQLARYNAAHGTSAQLLTRIANLWQGYSNALISGNNGQAAAFKNLINQLQPIYNRYVSLGGIIDRAREAIEREKIAVDTSSASLAVKNARLAELNAALAHLTPQTAAPFFTAFKAYVADAFSSIDKFLAAASRMGSIAAGGLSGASTYQSGISTIFSGLLGGGGGIGGVAGGFGLVSNAVNALFSALQRLPNPITFVQNALGSLASFISHTLSVAIGNLIATGFTNLINSMQNVGQAAFQEVAGFEALTYSLQFLIANQIRDADSSIQMGTALGMATDRAQELLGWIQHLAIISPFGVDDIRNSFQLAMSYGFTSEQATRLTRDVVDLAAATNRGTDIINRMTLAFGQIQSSGKLYGLQLRELAHAGFPVEAAFQRMAKAMGMTRAELDEFRQESAIPASIALEAMAQTMEDRAGGAAERMAGTLNGLTNSLQDLAKIALRNLFGPMEEGGTKVGGILGVIQVRLQSLVNYLQTDFFNTITVQAGDYFGELAENAFVWGENFIISFSNGMVAAFYSIVDTLISLADTIAYYLMPGSPPRILPELDKWGTQAMMVYMEGWTKVPRDLFTDIGKDLEAYFRSLPETVLGKVDLIPAIAAMRSNLTRLLSGNINISTFVGSLGTGGPDVTGYVSALMDLTQANQAVADAQKLVNDLTKKYDDLLKPIDDRLKEIDDAQQNFLDDQRKRELELVLKDPNATKSEKALAALEIQKLTEEQKRRGIAATAKKELDAAKVTLDAETEKQKQMQERFDLQEFLLKQQIEQNNLLKEYLSILDSLAEKVKAVKEKAGAAQPVDLSSAPTFSGIGVGDEHEGKQGKDNTPDPFATIKGKLADLQSSLAGLWAQIMITIAPVITAFDGVTDAVGRFYDKVSSTFPEIRQTIGELAAWTIEKLGTDVPSALHDLEDAIDNLSGWWDKNHTFIMRITTFVWKIIVNFIIITLQQISTFLKFITGIMNQDWEAFWIKVWTTTQKLIDVTKEVIRAAMQVILGIIQYWLGVISGDWARSWNGLVAVATGLWTLIEVAATIGIGAIKQAIDNAVLLITVGWDRDWFHIRDTVTGVMAALGTAFSGPLQKIRDLVQVVKDFWTWLTTHTFPKIDLLGGGSNDGGGGGGSDRTGMSTVETAASLSQLMGMGLMGGGTSLTNQYNYAPVYMGAPNNPTHDFEVMQVWSR